MSRVVSAVDDDDSENVINDLRVLHKSEVVEGATDPFAEPTNTKTYVGTSQNFRRGLSNKISKARQTANNGAGSKRIEEGFTGYDAFGVVTPPHNLDALTRLYEISSPHFAAVNAKVANIVGLGFRLVESTKTKRAFEQQEDEEKVKRARDRINRLRDELMETLDDWCRADTFVEVLVKIWRDYEVTGNGYLEIGRKADGTIGYLGHIPAQTMRVRRERDGFVQLVGHRVQFFANYGDTSGSNPIGGDKPNEVLHLKKYSPTSTYYGVPDIIAAQQAVAGNEFAARFNLDYFENKAVPRHLITLKGAKLGAAAESKLLSFFETSLKGQNHRSLYVPLPPDTDSNKVEFKIEKVEASVQDSSFNNYRKANHQDILMVHRVPITKVSSADGVNLAIARDADKTFKEQVCAPEQRILEKKLNKILREQTDALEIALNEMSLTDEDTMSKIDERLVKSGIMLPNEARINRGWPGIDGGNTRVDLNAKSSTANDNRRQQRQTNATDSAGEGRNTKGDGRTPGTE